MIAFSYPAGPHIRRHGPAGYFGYESYREWLRDEFTYRCVYCLHRERWESRAASFHIEHFIPVSVDPDGECVYENLLYACGTCNTAKSAALNVPDPCEIAFADCLKIETDGTVTALNEHGERLSDVLRLNRDSDVNIRARWIRSLTTLQSSDPELYAEYMAFPDDLTDLRRSVPKTNTKPEGIENCYFAIRERGELPATY